MCCYRETAIEFYKEKVKQIKNGTFDKHFEPQKGRDGFESALSNIDIRHSSNMTRNRWRKEDFKNSKYTDGWEVVKEVEGWIL